MFVGIHHTALSTPDLDRLVSFYQRCFDFEVEFDFSWDESNVAFQRTHAKPETRGRVAMLVLGDHRLEIFEYHEPTPKPDIERENADLGICHFCFEVKEIDVECERLREAGMPMQSELVAQANIKNCYGRDPDSNRVEVSEFFDRPVED